MVLLEVLLHHTGTLLVLVCIVAQNGAGKPGKLVKVTKIVGGVKTAIEKYPYQASVRLSGVCICGGAIISEKHVLTAAHCHIWKDLSALSVVVGALYDRGDGVSHQLAYFLPHENYEKPNNDIAIIKVKDAIAFSPRAQAIALPSSRLQLKEGDELELAGWGETAVEVSRAVIRALANRGLLGLPKEDVRRISDKFLMRPPKQLRSAKVGYIRRKKCRKAYKGTGYDITENMFCAGADRVDACHGDSGGGVEYNRTLVGIVSWGLGCGDERFFGINTNVVRFLDWIKLNMH